MEIVMEVSSWRGTYWKSNFYDIILEEERLLYEINRYDIMFIEGLGELQVDSVSLAGSYVTIYSTYMGGFVSGEDRLAEAPWA